MDNLIWLARNPPFTGDPLTVVRGVMRRARECAGASDQEFARLLQAAVQGRTITAAMVQAWEDRPPPPPGDVLAVAIGFLGLDLVVEPEESSVGPRTDAAPGATGDGSHAPAGIALSDIDMGRLHSAAANCCGIDRRIVEDLSVLTEEYWCMYHRMAPKSLQPVVGAHQDLMRRLLARASASPQRGHLAAALGQAAMLDGWLLFLLDDRRTARVRWAFAAELAEQFSDGPLRAHVLIARSSLVSQGGSGESTVAIALLDEADRVVGDSAPIRAWHLARRAEEHAALGRRSAAERRACARDLAAAQRLLAGDCAAGCLPGPKSELDWNGFRVNCALMLGHDQEAVEVLRAAVAAAPSDRATLRAVLLNDLGAALARLGQVDEACAVFSQSLALADETGAAVHAQRVAGAARNLERWRRSPQVVELLERLARLA